MSAELNPAAPHHLPPFITAPGESDVLLYIMIGVLLVFAFGLGVLYFRLHHLPEHLAGRGKKVQYEIVAVLALLAMFTHNHLFWIAGLLLAFVDLPDFTTPLNRMANALARMAAIKLPSPEAIPVVDLNDGEAPVAPARVDIDGTRSTSLQARRHEPAR
jgi:hypothetical protein